MTDRDGAVEQDEVLELRSGLRDNRAVSFIGVAQPLCVLERIENLINAGAAEKPGGEPQRDQGRALRAPERRASEHFQGGPRRSPEPRLVGHHQAPAQRGEAIAREAGELADHLRAHPMGDQPARQRGAPALP